MGKYAEAFFLTHVLLDHRGRVPLLIHRSFKGKICSTQATKELALTLFKEGNGLDLFDRTKMLLIEKSERKKVLR
jgi:metallo-beta-lactamase family protein